MKTKISGFTFIRNAVKADYPFIQSVESILPLCDEFIINAGDSEDTTNEVIENLVKKHPEVKWKIVHSVWDMSKRKGGLILSEQTNIALKECTGDWCFYIQADEIVHEEDLKTIQSEINKYTSDNNIFGLKLYWKHMAGSLVTYEASLGHYNQEIRIFKNHKGIESWGDAQSFRFSGKDSKEEAKIPSVTIDAEVYHYSHARAPDKMLDKIFVVGTWWHTDDELKVKQKEWKEKNPHSLENLIVDYRTPPKVMQEYINEATWSLKISDFKIKNLKSILLIFNDNDEPALIKEITDVVKNTYREATVQSVKSHHLSLIDAYLAKESHDLVFSLVNSKLDVLKNYLFMRLAGKIKVGFFDLQNFIVKFDIPVNFTNRNKKTISKPKTRSEILKHSIARIGCV